LLFLFAPDASLNEELFTPRCAQTRCGQSQIASDYNVVVHGQLHPDAACFLVTQTSGQGYRSLLDILESSHPILTPSAALQNLYVKTKKVTAHCHLP
jgi:hypothetical protein